MAKKGELPARILTLISILGLAAACSSNKEEDKPPTRVEQSPTKWDYKQVRETRAAEQGQTPATTSTDDTDCVMLTHDQMVRANVSGCRKSDPREGHGDDAYCCPKQ